MQVVQPERKRGRPRKTPATPVVPRRDDGEDDNIPSDENDWDEEGERKVSEDGYLAGGREYKFQTFTLPRHPTRLYLYSLDASKLLGFRDTYNFFLRNPKIRRINGNDEDRAHLEKMGLLPSSIKSRPITLARARDIFKEFGHKVIQRGRPGKDDYRPGEIDEQDYADNNTSVKAEEEDATYSVLDYSKIPQALDGGPFRRHGISIAGFPRPEIDQEQFEPRGAVPKELADDAWMYKCAISAADFNQRLNRNRFEFADIRPVSFLDLHTNIEQIASATQPTRVTIEKHVPSEESLHREKILKIDNTLICNRPKDNAWIQVADSTAHSHYPLAFTRDQYQETLPLYPHRFQDPSPAQSQEELEKEINAGPRVYPFDLPPTLMGSLPYKPTVQTVSLRKRGRPKRETEGDAEQECSQCQGLEAPTDLEKVPSYFKLSCARCNMKYHPACIDFEDSTMASKCSTYPWLCANCKVCFNPKCSHPMEENGLIYCDLCDRAAHMECLDPPLKKVPEGKWFCEECSECHSCGKKCKPEKITHVCCQKEQPQDLDGFLASFCPNCHDSFTKGDFCPSCVKTFNDEDVIMVSCQKCARWSHVGCDPNLTEEKYDELLLLPEPNWTCIMCDTRKRDRFVNGFDRKVDLVMVNGLPLYAPPLKE